MDTHRIGSSAPPENQQSLIINHNLQEERERSQSTKRHFPSTQVPYSFILFGARSSTGTRTWRRQPLPKYHQHQRAAAKGAGAQKWNRHVFLIKTLKQPGPDYASLSRMSVKLFTALSSAQHMVSVLLLRHLQCSRGGGARLPAGGPMCGEWRPALTSAFAT